MCIKAACVEFLVIPVLVSYLGMGRSELPDPPCGTNIFLEVGKQGTVHCRFHDFNILGWINGDGTPGESTPFIYLENSVKKGRGYTSGDYDMLPDGSLVINNVKLKHEFNFTVSLLPRVGIRMRFYVPVSVFVRPDPEYPVVNGLTNQQHIVQDVEFYSGSINCTMNGVRPEVELEWVFQSDVISVENEPPSVTSNADETYNTTLSSRFTITDRSVGRITLQCRVAGEMADLFLSVTTIYLLILNKYFPVVNGQARQRHLVLHLKRDDELTCSINRVSKDVSLEWVIVTFGLANEIIFKDHASAADNGDGTSNITLTSSFSVMSSSLHHVTLQCRVSGQGANLYPDVTTVEVLFSQNFPVVNGQARQQHLVLHLKRDDELTCSINRVSKDVSLEWVIVTSGLSSEIIFKDHASAADNGDGTSNVTLTSSFSVMSSSLHHVTLQCRVSGQGANLYPDVTTVEVFFSDILPIPVIEGCYSQQEDCTLKMPKDGTLTCSVIAVPVEYMMDKGLDIFADYSGLSLTRIKNDHLPHINGDYDLTTSYQYTVDEVSTESVIQCSLTGVKNNQPFNSTATARIIWQGTAFASNDIARWMLALIITIFLVTVTSLIINIVLFKKQGKITEKDIVHDPGNQGDVAMKDRNSHQEIQESEIPLVQETQTTEAGVKEMFTTIISLLATVNHRGDLGS